jgi:hypothetical protein
VTKRVQMILGAAVSAGALSCMPDRLVAQASSVEGAVRVIAADTPSTQIETRRQRDSLTVYLLRRPKGKPATAGLSAEARAERRKFEGREVPPANVAAIETPLPQRATTRKQ